MFGSFLRMNIPENIESSSHLQSIVLGSILSPIIIPFMMILFFQLSAKYRNWASRIKIFFWCGIFYLVLTIGTLGEIVREA